MSEFLNGLITVIGIVLFIAIIGSSVYFLFYYGVDYKQRAAERLERHINAEALNGNEFALRIAKKASAYDIKYKDRKIFEEALKGNKNALILLGIEKEGK